MYKPYALLYHDEGSSRGVGAMHGEDDEALFLSRWSDYRDPYYNPNFEGPLGPNPSRERRHTLA